MEISPTKEVFEQEDRYIFEQVKTHIVLAQELLKAESVMKSISLNLYSLRFCFHTKFKKETLKNTERLYSEIRTLRESIGNDFQKLFEGQEKYDGLRLHYAYRLNTIKEIEELFQKVDLLHPRDVDYGDSPQNPPF